MARHKNMKTPIQAANKWSAGMMGASQTITDGVNATTVSPGVQAAKRADYWLAQLTAAKKKWTDAMNAMTLSSWQNGMISKGIPRIAGGINGGMMMYQTWLEQFLPAVQSTLGQLNQTTPRQKGNLQVAAQRAMAIWTLAQKQSAAYKRSGK